MAARYTTTIAMLTKLASIKGSSELVGSGCALPGLNSVFGKAAAA